MKKYLAILSLSLVLTACAGTDDIASARGSNSALLTQAELDQYNKQRNNEVAEAATQATKAAAYSSTVSSVSSGIQSAVDVINSVKGLFGR